MQPLSRHLVFAFSLLTVGFAAGQAQSARIPTTHETSLTGTEVTLPDDLKGKVGVLVVGFSKSSGDVCKGWGQRLMESYRDSHEVMSYQIPVLASVPKFIRGVVVKSIKSSMPEAQQSHFLLLSAMRRSGESWRVMRTPMMRMFSLSMELVWCGGGLRGRLRMLGLRR